MKKLYIFITLVFSIFILNKNEIYAQCQTINASVSSSIAPDPVDSVVRICQGVTVTFTGTATFTESSDGATYDWKINNVGGYSTTTTFTNTFTSSGIYVIDFLPYDAEMCTTKDCNSRIIVHVSATPIFAGTAATDSVCINELGELIGVVTPVPQSYECAPPISDTTFLPDGSGAVYTTSIDVTCYTTCDTISDGTDIENLCLILEHSYLGDLEIVIICPNGQEATIKPYPGGGGTYLGEPLDFGGSDGLVGVGWQYCFNDITPNPTLLGSVGTGFIVPGVGTPASGSIGAGEYAPFESFDELIGCPLNGSWTIEVTDHLWSDDGYIFGWWIDFNVDIDDYSFVNNYPTSLWTGPGVVPPGSDPAIIDPIAPGPACYVFSVTDNFGCNYDTTVCNFIKDLPNPGTDSSALVCKNLGTIYLFDYLGGTPEFGGYWTGTSVLPDGTLNTTDLDAGFYEYIYTVQNTFCDTTATVTLEVKNSLELDFDITYSLGCNDDTVHFNNTSDEDLTYIRWEFGDGTNILDNPSPSHVYSPQGEYSVWLVAQNSDGCVDSLQKLVNTLHPFEAIFTQSNDSICQAGVNNIAFYDGSTGNIAAWNWDFGDGQTSTDQNPVINFTQHGTHEVRLIVTDFLGCFDTAYSFVYVDSLTQLDAWFEKDEICKGEIAKMGANFNPIITQLNWDFGDMTNQNKITDENAHSYTEIGDMILTVTADHLICPSIEAKDTIRVKPYPLINLGIDTFLCLKGAPIYMDPHLQTMNPTNTKYTWSHGDTTSATKITVPGTYKIIADLDGCITTDEFIVHKDCYIDIPNAFTPNGDGDNDYFFPRQYLSRGVVDFKFEVYNRWGEKVFETNNADGKGWDGRYNNQDQPNGVYVYQITVRYKNMASEKYTGNVTLIR